ncbi:MAG: hypothetical protein FJZ00_06620, partial [Candidatus Sericytochromatia bacterium]|nr:hypothetical protein [Candidatus Tanganyikabacteria bacterium]
KADPRGMIAFFKVLEKEGAAVPKEFEFLSDHPHTADRIAMLERQAAKAAYEPEPLLPGRSWKDIKQLCR